MKSLDKFNAVYNQIISEMVENASAKTNDEICKNWGYINQCEFDEEFAKKFKAAKQEHEQMVKNNPDEHDSKLQESVLGNCVRKYSCKCGYSYKVDSSRIIFKYISTLKRRKFNFRLYFYFMPE